MQQGDEVENFLGGYHGYLSYYPYYPHGYTYYRPHYGYHGYGYGKIKAIEDAIESFRAASIATAQSGIDAEGASFAVAAEGLRTVSADATTGVNDGFTTTTGNLIEGIVMNREDSETDLAAAQQSAEDALAGRRSEIEQALTDLKLDKLEKVKELQKKLWGYYGYGNAYHVKSEIEALK